MADLRVPREVLEALTYGGQLLADNADLFAPTDRGRIAMVAYEVTRARAILGDQWTKKQDTE